MKVSFFRRGPLLAGMLLLGDCGAGSHDNASNSPGSMAVAVENLPSGVAGSITVSNDSGFSRNVSATETLSGLTPGSYTLSAVVVTNGGNSYRPSTPSQTVIVPGGGTAHTSVTYTSSPASYAAISAGFHNRSMIVDGITRNYQIYIPPGYSPAVSQRVILYCHGSGEGGTDNVHQVTVGLGKYITDNGNTFPDVVVFAQNPFGLGDLAAGALTTYRIYKSALDLTVAEVNTDLARVLVTGISAGATHTWTQAYQQPTRFAAIAPIAQWVVARRMLIDDAAQFGEGPVLAYTRLPTLPIHEYWGENDANSNFQADKSGLSRNPNYSLIEVAGADHTGTWDKTYASPAFWTWFRAQHR